MPSLDISPILHAVRQAARLCMEVQQRHVARQEKDGHEPVTIADYGSQAILCRAIQHHFPDDGIMAEENGTQFMTLLTEAQRQHIVGLIGDAIGKPTSAEEVRAWLDHGKGKETPRLWVIDPIDGTKGFLALRHYVVAVGVMQDRHPVAGILGAPAYPGMDEGALLYALEDEAYFVRLFADETPRRIRVSTLDDTAQFRALESVEKGHSGLARLARAREIAGMSHLLVDQADSMEKYGRLAAGDAEVYMRLPRLGSTRPHNIWDHAPGVAILWAAGGVATDVDGSPLDFQTGTSLNNYGVIASNGTRHAELIAAVQALLQEEAAEQAAEHDSE